MNRSCRSQQMKIVPLLLFVSATSVHGATLPGFRVEPLAMTTGFVTSVVSDSRGRLYYTTTAGDIVRLDGAESTVVAHVQTEAIGNSGLLGMALRDDATAVVHYTTYEQIYDVIAAIDLTTGRESLIHSFQGDILNFGPVSSEHHGGNPIVTADGSIFVAIGDGNAPILAARPDWNLGKIFRIAPNGSVDEYALGVRNPFDLAWDEVRQRVIAPDNGDSADDEINIVHQGDDLGWPSSMGDQPAAAGSVAPIYRFPTVVAPTGIVALSGQNAMLVQGYLLSAFVTRAIYYIRDIDAPQPIALIQKETDSIVDVTESPTGDIYFATGRTIYRLIPPRRGDCNGDGSVDAADLGALTAEVAYGPHAAVEAREGTWGCDVDGNGLIDELDIAVLHARLAIRRRSVR